MEDLAAVMNHPLVFPTLKNPPAPYYKSDAIQWTTQERTKQLPALAALMSLKYSVPVGKFPAYSPVAAIRYQGRLIGSCLYKVAAGDAPFAEQSWEVGTFPSSWYLGYGRLRG